MFTLLNVPAPAELNYPEFRLTLDEKKDFELIDIIYRRLYPKNPSFSTLDIISLLRSNPVLVEMNQEIKDTGSWDALRNQ
jgi:spore coat polysaccharide biosynthesis protein SpsF (cytidylyltransferase family)